MGKKTRSKRIRAKLKGVKKVSLSQKIKPYLSLRHPITRFCLLFVGLLVVFSLLLYQEPIRHYFSNPVTTLIASQVAWILKALGMKVYASGIIIYGEGFSVRIVGNCNAIFEIFMFLSAVIAFPALQKEKLMGGIPGIIFIYFINLLRLVLLFLIGVYAPQYFEEAHLYVGQSFFIVMVAIFWLFWVGKCVKYVPT